MDENIPFKDGVPEKIKTKLTMAENRLSDTLGAMYACPVCGREMYTTVYPVVACPNCKHEQNTPNDP